MLFLFSLLLIIPAGNVQAAKLNKTKLTLYTGQTYSLKVQDSKTAGVFQSNNSSVASVGKKTGVVKALKKGTAKITVTAGKTQLICQVTVKSSVELTNYLNKDYNQLAKAVGNIRRATKYEEPVSYTGTLFIYTKSEPTSGDFFFRIQKNTNKITSLQNRIFKKVTFYGIRLGDKKANVEKILKKKGFSKKKSWTIDTKTTSDLYESSKYSYRFQIWYENGKASCYSLSLK